MRGPSPSACTTGSASAVLSAQQDTGKASATRRHGQTSCPWHPKVQCRRASSVARRSAFTLLELILALGLTIVILGLVVMAIYIHLGVTEKSRGKVEEVQTARALLQRMADDLRNALPFVTASGSSSAGGSATGSTPLDRRPRAERSPVPADR